ncbi:MAG: DUF6519 domain-containing protein [Anaerolineae bacterium]
MKGDFTRNTFVPSKSFSRVLMQQGRVQLDADWNEQIAIFWHHLRTLIVDLIGPHGGPEHRLGFAIKPKDTLNFHLSRGHYYVDGLLCDARWPFHYEHQPYYPLRETEHLEPNTDYLVYLDVWERHVTCVEDDDIREVALGGPDTATRAQLVYQVKTVALAPGEVPDAAASEEDDARLAELKKRLEELHVQLKKLEEEGDEAKAKEVRLAIEEVEAQIARMPQGPRGPSAFSCDSLLKDKLLDMGRFSSCALAARAYVEPTPDEPCIIPPEARYRGPENQLYRVEIHRPGHVGKASFKWSRENGSVIFPVRSLKTDSESDTTTVSLEHLGRDGRFGLQAGDWVEIVDDDYVLQGRAEPLLKVTHVDRTEFRVTLERTPASDVGEDADKHPLLRRWDQKADPDTDLRWGVPVQEGKPLDLEDGVQIRFEPLGDGKGSKPKQAQPLEEVKPVETSGALYNTGDYWLVPARTATGDVEWPTREAAEGREVPIPRPPHGIQHHYAPLGIITVQDNEKVDQDYIDCRRKFRALAKPIAAG